MNKKIVIILVEAIIVLLFLLAVNFFYGLKMADTAAVDYQEQAKRMSVLLSKSVDAAKSTKQANWELTAQVGLLDQTVQDLRAQNETLKADLERLKVEAERLQVNAQAIIPIKEKLKSISAQLDSVNISSARKDELDKLCVRS